MYVTDVSLDTYGTEPLTIGPECQNIGIDGNEIQARVNGAASKLFLNGNGGGVYFGIGDHYYISSDGSNYNGNAASATKLDGYYTTLHYNDSKLGGFYGKSCIPVIGNNDGVMEVGKYIDFHTYTPSTSLDYATRIVCDSAPGNIVSLPSSDGTLALTTDNVASATKATQDGNGNDIESTYATKLIPLPLVEL
jgi:hypothetical protein